MDTKRILHRSWQQAWHYKALWILGMVLALTAANTIYLGFPRDDRDIPLDNKIKISEYSTIILPGEGLTIDLTAPEGHRVILTDGPTKHDIQFLTYLARQLRLSDLNAVALEIVTLVLLISLIAIFARYIAETAMICMVNDMEEGGKQLQLWQGVRMGWSARAARLFLIDLLTGLAGVGFVALILLLIFGPILLIKPFGIIASLLTAFGAFGFLILTLCLFVVWSILLSLIMQTVRRACVIDNKGVFASIGVGISLLKNHLKDVGMTWLIWIAIRILWAPVSVLTTLIISPILLLSLLAGILIGLAPGVIATGIASIFVHGAIPWIIGGLAWLPIFLLVTITPILLIGGWVEIYKSSLWTLAYREYSAQEHTVPLAQPERPLVQLPGVAG
jgi:hypothetical protein